MASISNNSNAVITMDVHPKFAIFATLYHQALRNSFPCASLFLAILMMVFMATWNLESLMTP